MVSTTTLGTRWPGRIPFAANGVPLLNSPAFSPGAGVPGSAQFITSAIYSPCPRLVFDIGLMGRLAGPVPKAMFIAGVTYSIADVYRNIHDNDSSQLDLPHRLGLRKRTRIAAFSGLAASQ